VTGLIERARKYHGNTVDGLAALGFFSGQTTGDLLGEVSTRTNAVDALKRKPWLVTSDTTETRVTEGFFDRRTFSQWNRMVNAFDGTLGSDRYQVPGQVTILASTLLCADISEIANLSLFFAAAGPQPEVVSDKHFKVRPGTTYALSARCQGEDGGELTREVLWTVSSRDGMVADPEQPAAFDPRMQVVIWNGPGREGLLTVPPDAVPGTYQVTATLGSVSSSLHVQVEPDPGAPAQDPVRSLAIVREADVINGSGVGLLRLTALATHRAGAMDALANIPLEQLIASDYMDDRTTDGSIAWSVTAYKEDSGVPPAQWEVILTTAFSLDAGTSGGCKILRWTADAPNALLEVQARWTGLRGSGLTEPPSDTALIHVRR